MGRTACTEPQCLYKGALYLEVSYCGRFFIKACVDCEKLCEKLKQYFTCDFTLHYIYKFFREIGILIKFCTLFHLVQTNKSVYFVSWIFFFLLLKSLPSSSLLN